MGSCIPVFEMLGFAARKLYAKKRLYFSHPSVLERMYVSEDAERKLDHEML